ncbi:AGAMOUS-like 92 [Arabidopsis thaliana]|uniref:Agamous-like MADS-box protein AGL92 n=1 Tax=Arabidopsis thaliana TaxID=3702 RepID=AGL92_ARATH|nr:AGAMOUS-like 92 [Arabidopsis thaliana]Q9C6V4.1 RecName: Full=Agamous-like MADS-box protein AGL92 [Arabidopsis thaliana]AAG60139.1 MADS box transcription factor, putative [Arabidopsis thaliana]AEE31379.1 AGAMOUS-like 92 [Arabidopsis thaliana]|eukprot:NP_174445.1 AGAMOUS-like 92 [Arabidopsis thaliana]
MRTKTKLVLIPDRHFRRATFRKRNAGIRKKLHELTTLCDIKACAVIYSPFENPTVWPSTEGVQEVISEFMEKPATERSKTMMSHETFLRDQITKEQNKLESLRRENRETQLKHFMFDCVGGKMSEQQYGARDLQDLSLFTDQYLNQLNARKKFLTEYGESSSSVPPLFDVAGANPPVVADQAAVTVPPLFAVAGANLPVVADQAAVTVPPLFAVAGANLPVVADQAAVNVPTGFHNMNVNQNQYEPVQPYVPTGFSDHIQYQNMNFNQNQQEPVHYQALAVAGAGLPMTQNQYEPVHYQSLAVAGGGLPMSQLQYEPVQPYIPTVFSDNVQYQHMNLYQNQQEPVHYQALGVAGAGLPMNQNQYEPVQPYVPTGFSDHFQFENMNLNQNQQEPVQYQAPVDFNHQIQQGNYDMNLNQNMKHAHIPFMDGNYYNYHQPPTVGLTSTGHMPSTTTTTTNNNNNNNV